MESEIKLYEISLSSDSLRDKLKIINGKQSKFTSFINFFCGQQKEDFKANLKPACY